VWTTLKRVGVVKRKKKASKRNVVVKFPRRLDDDDESEYEEDKMRKMKMRMTITMTMTMTMRMRMTLRTTMKMLCRNPSLTMVTREQTTTLLVETENQIQACLNQKKAVWFGSEICWRRWPEI
jgi:hypothetical protein